MEQTQNFEGQELKERTLMGAFENLNQNIIQLKEATSLTKRLNNKLNRRDTPDGEIQMLDKDSVKEPTIVDLFYNVSRSIENEINTICEETNKSIGLIE